MVCYLLPAPGEPPTVSLARVAAPAGEQVVVYFSWPAGCLEMQPLVESLKVVTRLEQNPDDRVGRSSSGGASQLSAGALLGKPAQGMRNSSNKVRVLQHLGKKGLDGNPSSFRHGIFLIESGCR